MITSFKLPDLVLGVNIRADVRGAKAAARQLRNAVASEFARAGGAGLAGLGGGAAAAAAAGGGMLAPFLGSALGSMIGTQAGGGRGMMPFLPQLTGKAGPPLLGLGGKPIIDVRNRTGMLSWPNQFRKYLRDKDLVDEMVGKLVDFAGFIGQGARGLFTRMFTGTSAAVGKGTQVGLLSGLRKSLRLWHFLIGGLIIGTVVGGAKRMMGPALQYIRNTGTTTGRYGAFSNAAEATPSALRNVSVQFGLMAIELLDLDKALQGFNRVLVQTGSVMAWLGQQKWLKLLLQSSGNVAWLKLINQVLNKLPTGKGGVDLGKGGFSSRMAPAALQGSVQAYSILQGNLMNYAAATARNTKQTVDALNKIIERAPQMGVVAG